MAKRTQSILISIIIWSLYLLFPLATIPEPSRFLPGDGFHLKLYFVLSFLSIGFYYFNYSIAIPRFYLNRKYGKYVLLMVLSLAFILFMIWLFTETFAENDSQTFINKRLALTNFLLRFFLMFMTSFGISFYIRYRQSESEKIKAELSALKHQINPHFLFNILNDLYGRAITKSDDIADHIAKLSAMMRYVLTDAAAEKVALEKEIEYLESYIDLQTGRLTDKTKVSFACTGNRSNLFIPPLLLINFIENAFKHGVSTETETAISVNITTEGKQLYLDVKNDIPRRSKQPVSHYLGLDNTRRRLDLLYRNNYSLDIQNQKDTFTVKLSINLS